MCYDLGLDELSNDLVMRWIWWQDSPLFFFRNRFCPTTFLGTARKHIQSHLQRSRTIKTAGMWTYFVTQLRLVTSIFCSYCPTLLMAQNIRYVFLLYAIGCAMWATLSVAHNTRPSRLVSRLCYIDEKSHASFTQHYGVVRVGDTSVVGAEQIRSRDVCIRRNEPSASGAESRAKKHHCFGNSCGRWALRRFFTTTEKVICFSLFLAKWHRGRDKHSSFILLHSFESFFLKHVSSGAYSAAQ